MIFAKKQNLAYEARLFWTVVSDILKVVNGYFNLWNKLYTDINGEKKIEKFEDLINRDVFLELLHYLNVFQFANTVPCVHYAQYIDIKLAKIHRNSNEIIDKYTSYLNSEVFLSLKRLSEHKHNSIGNHILSQKQYNIPCQRALRSNYIIIDAELDEINKNISALHQWLIVEFESLNRNGKGNIRDPKQISSFLKRTVPVRLTDEQIISDLKSYNDWAKKQLEIESQANIPKEWCEVLDDQL